MMQTCSVNMDFVFLLLLSVTLCCGDTTTSNVSSATSNVSSTTNGSLPTAPLSTTTYSAENITTAIVSDNGTVHSTSNVSIKSPTAAKAEKSKSTSKSPSTTPSTTPSTPSTTPSTKKPGLLVAIMVILFLLIGVVIFIFVFMCQKYRKVSFRVNGKCDDHDETVPLENVQPLDAEAAGATAGVTGGIDNVVKETDEKTAVGDAPAAVDGTAGKDLKEETKQEAPITSPSEGGDDKESIDTKNGPTVGESDEKDDGNTADDKDEEEEKKDGAKDEKSDSSSISLLSPDEISKATMAMESSPTEGSQETAAMNENSNNNNNNNNNIARASRQRVGGELVSSPLNPLGMTRSPAEMSAPAYVTMEKNAVWEDGAAAFSAL